ncbi:MAG: type II toxin-antitoxin system VapB family antitoxin [Spirosomaceae bacterium]|jgi:Arc/MetJ family transcription regulator|nr:type II toxin-antitoxin system VapB family antitoxin [Spirosomataceae bacterium]
MRTNIDLDDKLVEEAMSFGKIKTKKKLIEEALISYIKLQKRMAMIELFGNVQWEGDLMQMRESSYEKFSL